MKTLIVARRFNNLFPNKIGGVIASSENLINFFQINSFDFDVIDTNKSHYKSKFLYLFKFLFNLSTRIRKFDHLALNLRGLEVCYLAPISIVIAYFFKVPISLRVFGGNIDKLKQSNLFYSFLIDFSFRNVSVVFLQTKQLISYFNYHHNLLHFPTCRFVKHKLTVSDSFHFNFVFSGNITKSKGIDWILKLADDLPYITVDFYGPLIDYSSDDLNTPNTTYKGLYSPTDYALILSKYDFLIFPTTHEGEGYPGVIIECLLVGLPVITTNWNAISELINDGTNGLLIDSTNLSDLYLFVEKLNSDIYRKMVSNILLSPNKYDCDFLLDFYVTNLKAKEIIL